MNFKKYSNCVLLQKFAPFLVVWGDTKQLVVLNVVRGFLLFLEGYPFFVMIAKGASWLIHLHFLFRDFFQREGLVYPKCVPRCSLDSSRTFSHPYFCGGRINFGQLVG